MENDIGQQENDPPQSGKYAGRNRPGISIATMCLLHEENTPSEPLGHNQTVAERSWQPPISQNAGDLTDPKPKPRTRLGRPPLTSTLSQPQPSSGLLVVIIPKRKVKHEIGIKERSSLGKGFAYRRSGKEVILRIS